MSTARTLTASLLAFLVGAVGMHVVDENRPSWACGHLDRVVVADGSCADLSDLVAP